ATYNPVPVAGSEVLGNVGSVFTVSVSNDTVTWTDDSLSGGAQWSRSISESGDSIELGTKTHVGTIISRMTDVSHGPWMQGDVSLRIAEDESGWNTRLVATSQGTTLWSEPIHNDDTNYRIHDGRV